MSGCGTEIQKLTFTQEELREIDTLPEYKIWLDEDYIKLEKQNNAEHLVPVDLLKIVFSEKLSDLPLDGITRYVKAAALEKVPGLEVKITDQVIAIGKESKTEQESYNYVNLKWDEPLGYLFLVNQDYPLHDDYEDQSLTVIKSPYLQPLYNNMRLSQEALLNLNKMSEDYYKDNKVPMILVSTYRDYNHQERIFTTRIAANRNKWSLSYEDAYKKAAEIIAIPGTSEHQSGLAIDFSNANLLKKGTTLVNDFSQEKEGKWLLNKGKDYGFILRYPKDKTEITKIVFEPWHYRYVGHPHSEIMYEKDWTLEEYLEYIEEEREYLTEDYSVFYLDSEKIFGYEIYYNDNIKIENDNKGGWILNKTTK